MNQENRPQAFAIYSQYGHYCEIFLPQDCDGAFPGQQELREALLSLDSLIDLSDPNLKVLRLTAAVKQKIGAVIRKYHVLPNIMDNRPPQRTALDIFGSLFLQIPDDSTIILKQTECPENRSRFVSYAARVLHLFAHRLNKQSEAEPQQNPKQQSKSHGGGACPQAPQSNPKSQKIPKPRPAAPKPITDQNKPPPTIC